MVAGGIDEASQIFLDITTRRNRQTLADIIRRNVEPGSIIQTDGWAAYKRLERYNYVHKVVIHDRNFVRDTGVTTNRIEATKDACKMLFQHTKQTARYGVRLSRRIRVKKKFSGALFENFINEIRRIYLQS
ncbi:hypothetical protein RF11_07725 [Thelohanellus kitauei]|uniref:ISXO2-like transposase domain-containing protein n=1 Tax=Thelohanellus kitauei TaxID=669202 RepID=A0A0C2N076_THEKT|nr:hypothetical protein RF11_07725 [Thelohanellus kitauei]